ncbi:MAG: amino acid adenylation domain-containing protein, partial [Granulosicoccus sp.]
MIPHAFVALSHIPLTPSGKADRRALPQVDATIAQAEYVAPQGVQEQRIANAIAELLEIEQVGRHDSFFALGGHSLLAVRLAARLEAEVGITVPIRTLFENPDIISFGTALDALVAAGDTVAGAPLEPVDRTQNIPLSYSQEQFWVAERIGDQHGVNAQVLAYDLTGDVDSERMRRVIAALFARHEALRLRVELVDRSAVQVFADAEEVPFEEIDLSAQSIEEQQRSLADLQRAPIDPRKGVFWTKLIRMSNDIDIEDTTSQVLLIGLHYMAHDGVSLAIIMGEFAALWTADADVSILPVLPVQYTDFAVWQRKAMDDGHLAKGLDRFETILGNPPAELALPSDRVRPELPSHESGSLPIVLSVKLTEQLRQLASEQGATLFMVLESTLAVLLSRYARTDDLIIGTVVAGRSNAALEGVVGPCMNMTALRHRIDPDATFVSVLQDTRTQALSAFDDQLVPYEGVLRRVIKKRNARLAFTPLFQVLFQLHNEFNRLPDPFVFDGITAHARGRRDAPVLQDLSFDLFEGDGQSSGIEGQLSYARDLFDADRMERLVAHYQQLLTSIAKHPQTALNALTMITDHEKNLVLNEFSAKGAELSQSDSPTMAHVVAELALSQPYSCALLEAGQNATRNEALQWFGFTYAELETHASQLANVLLSREVEHGDVIGVCLNWDTELLVTLFAIWKVGAIYLPLDSNYPNDRLSFMLEDAEAKLVIAVGDKAIKMAESGADLLRLDSTEVQSQLNVPSTERMNVMATAESLAYLIYTSGSTGKPKGVMVAHAQLMALRNAVITNDSANSEDTIFSASAPIFDAFFSDLVSAFGTGARLVRLQARSLAEVGYLEQATEAYAPTYMDLTPSVWRAALASGWQPSSQMRLFSGGEALDAELAGRLMANGARLFNCYGPTEATVTATMGEVMLPLTGRSITIGRPLPGTFAYVLDSYQRPLPIGVKGELVLGGLQITNGYLNRTDLTATAFITDPFSKVPGARAYRTGDLVSWRSDGQLDFHGRIDTQVKIRGMRVELGEIEEAIGALDGIGQAVVTALVDDDGQAQLCAYLVPDIGGTLSESEVAERIVETEDPQLLKLNDFFDLGSLRILLQQVLPDHMIPHLYVAISRMPTTTSGKVDRRALPDVDVKIAQAEYVAPQSEQEQRVADSVAELLDIDQVGRNDSFFALGGHSLLAVRLASRLEAELDIAIPIRAIFENPDVASFAAALDRLVEIGDTVTGPSLVAVDRSQDIPLSYSQERLWFVERFGDQMGANAMVVAYELSGIVDTDRMERVIATLYARHEALRMRVAMVNRSPVQVFAASDNVPYEIVDLLGQSADAQQLALERFHATPIDPRKGVFWAKLIRCSSEYDSDGNVHAERASKLLLGIHHMAYDGVSLAIIMSEFIALWNANGDELILPAIPVQYADFAFWQREALDSGQLALRLDRFEKILRNPPAELELPSDRPRPKQPSHDGAKVDISISHELTEQLRRLASEQNATLFMVLESALAVLLSRYARTDDLIIGTVVAGRSNAALEGAVGPFLNMVAMRHRIDSQATYLNVLKDTRSQALSAFDDQLVPYEAILRRVVKERSARLAFAPLFQVLFQLHNESGEIPDPLTFGEVTAHAYGRQESHALHDLTFDLFEEDGQNSGIAGQLSYATDLFDADRMEGLVAHYHQLLKAIVAQPDVAVTTLSMISDAERHRVLNDFNVSFDNDEIHVGDGLDVSNLLGSSLPTLAEQLTYFAQTQPDAPALTEVPAVDTPSVVTWRSYADLDEDVIRLARVLQSAGVVADDVVGVCVERDSDLLTTLFAIWRLGATYLPLDSTYPEERLSFMLDDAKVVRVVTSAMTSQKLAALGANVLNLDSA